MASAALVLDELRIIDTDAHISEPFDLWSSRAPATRRDRLPRIENVDGENHWIVDLGIDLGTASPDERRRKILQDNAAALYEVWLD